MHIKSGIAYTVLLCFISIQLAFAVPGAKLVPVNLACELFSSPMGIDVKNPGFSYTIKSQDADQRGIIQRAYQIVLSASPDFNKREILWDSQKVQDSRMAYIIYKGRALKSSHLYYWKVRIWDQSSQPSAWSKVARFTTGILSPEKWQAKWITATGAEKYALSPVGFKSSEAVSPDQSKWVQVDLGTVRKFSEVSLSPLFYADRDGYDFPLRFKVETANDSLFRSSSIIADYTSADVENPGFKPFHIYKAGEGRFLRLTITKLAPIGDKFMYALRQIEVLSAGQNIAAGKIVTVSDSDDSNGFNKSNLTDQVSNYQTFPNYSSILFRKNFFNKAGLVHAIIHLSGLSQYELTINSSKIGDYLLTPGWTNYKKTVLYDTYDVTSQILRGDNTIGILVGNGMYNIQPDTLRYVKFLSTFGPAKVTAQLRLEYADGTVTTVSTDKTWSVAPGPITYSNLYGGEDYDANKDQHGWDKPGFKTGDQWASAVETTGPGGVLKGLSCAAPPIKAIDTLSAVKITKIRENLWIYDFGQNASMMPLLSVDGPKGSYVRLIPAELLGQNGLVDRRSATQGGARPAWWQYTLCGGGAAQWFPKFFYQGARYLQVELFPANVSGRLPSVTRLRDVIVHSSSTPVGNFQCSDSLFNRIYSLVRWAQMNNMMSLMTDCPQREKMGWLEENHLNGPSLRYNFDMAPLFRKTMNDMADSQLDNGLIPNIAPEYFIAGAQDMANGFRNSPEWGSSFIIVPWQQYQFSGDISLLKRYYDKMKRYMAFLSAEAKDDIIYTGLGDWYDIGPKEPWGSQLTPVAFTATAIYYCDNLIMYHIARLLNKRNDEVEFSSAAKRIGNSFNKTFFNPKIGSYATGSQTSSALPLYLNVVEPANRLKLLNKLLTDIQQNNNSFTSGEVGYRFLLRALADGGSSDVVYKMNHQSDKPGYGYQLKMGATSLTEKWDASVGNFGSQDHFMSGEINEWFFNNLVGISPDTISAGFRKFNIKPAFIKQLKWVNGEFSSISGNIVCKWKRVDHVISLNIEVPVNTTATLYLDDIDPGSIYEGSKPINKSNGIKYKYKTSESLAYELGSGAYSFTINN